MQTKQANPAARMKSIDRLEIFSRNDKFCQVFVVPVVFSFPANSYQTALDMPIGLDSLGRVLRDVPPFARHEIDVAPHFVAGSWSAVEETDGFSSMTLARTGDWSLVDLRNGTIDASDLTILNRRIAVRHVALRVIGDKPIDEANIAIPHDVMLRMVQMIKFSTMSGTATATDALSMSGVAVGLQRIEPFVSGMFAFNAIRTRAILNHMALASSAKAGADGSMSYEIEKDDAGVERVRVNGVRKNSTEEYSVSVMMTGHVRDYEPVHGSVEHSRAVLVDVARQHGVELVAPVDAPRLN